MDKTQDTSSKVTIKYKKQDFQTDAANAVVNVFKGQASDGSERYIRQSGVYYPEGSKEWLEDIGVIMSPIEYSSLPSDKKEALIDEYEAGYGNKRITISKDKLLDNLHTVQANNHIPLSDDLSAALGDISLDIEMETGTGKTYTYIKTVHELYKNYGWSKYILVVPSIAIREGALKSFELLEDHFRSEYGKTSDGSVEDTRPLVFLYDSKNLNMIDMFSKTPGIAVMIINKQAFDKTEINKIYECNDRFGARRPIDVIAANRPIVIVDEPQAVLGTADEPTKAFEALRDNFNPLFSINYSATHKQTHNTVYRLDPLDAYEKRIVKKIEVKGVELDEAPNTEGYIHVSDFIPGKPEVKLVFAQGANADEKESALKEEDDLYSKSKRREEYKNVKVEKIVIDRDDISNSYVTISFGDGSSEKLKKGDSIGESSEKHLRRAQIRETIRSHLDKEQSLFNKGIKCLSLFFIDRVANYREYDKNNEPLVVEYGKMFEEEYEALYREYIDKCDDEDYKKYLQKIKANKTHTGYFAIDKKDKTAKDNEGGDEEKIAAYDLILKDKEKLLSFKKDVRFIFAHSALREGWDNPNVFQIGVLKHAEYDVKNNTTRRQEVGRGLRLCVDQNGNRYDDFETVHDVNLLTVIAPESYAKYAEALQKDIREDMYRRPAKFNSDFLTGKSIRLSDGKTHLLDDKESNRIVIYLDNEGYLDDDENLTAKFYADVKSGVFDERMKALFEVDKRLSSLSSDLILGLILGVKELAFSIGSDIPILNADNKRVVNKIKPEKWNLFDKLWRQIRQKAMYIFDIEDKDAFIGEAVKTIKQALDNASIGEGTGRYHYTVGVQDKDEFKISEPGKPVDFGELKEDYALKNGRQVKYDLIGRIADVTGFTRDTIASILAAAGKDAMRRFALNPEKFIKVVSKAINGAAGSYAELSGYKGLRYEALPEKFDKSIFETVIDNPDDAAKGKRSVLTYVVTDALSDEGVENKFWKEMDNSDEVSVYAKLPRGFKIPTLAGEYTPDWAVVFDTKDNIRHIWFVAETKGSPDEEQRRGVENIKIDCAKRLFSDLYDGDVKYTVVAPDRNNSAFYNLLIEARKEN